MRGALARPGDRPGAAGTPPAVARPAPAPRPYAAWLITLALAIASTAVFLVLVVPIPDFDPDDQLAWPVFVGAFALTEIAVGHFVVRGQLITVSLREIPLVVGFYFLAPADLVAVQLVGSGLAMVARRRLPVQRIALDLAASSLASSLGILAFRAITPLAPGNLPVWSLASLAGATTAVVVIRTATFVALVLTARGPDVPALRTGLAVGLPTAFVNTSVALVAAVFLRTQPDGIWLLGAPTLVGLLGYRAFSAQRQRQARLEYLYDCTQMLHGPVLDDAVLSRVLVRTREMFRADAAEAILVATSGDRPAMRIAVDAEGPPSVEVPGSDVMADRRAMLGPGGGGRVIVARAGSPDTSRPPVRDAMVVPLRGTGDLEGVLVVSGRAADLAPFTTDDLRVLEALASRLALVAENSGLVAQLEDSLADVSQLAAIVQSSEDAIVAVDLEGRVTAWNPAAEHLLGQPAGEVVGRAASEVLAEGGAAHLRDSFATALRGAVLRDVRMDWTRTDGRRTPVSITIFPVRSANGEVAAASAIVRDQSDRARAEAALATSAELLRTVIDGSPLGMGVAGPDHRWIEANPALCALLGTSEGDAIGRSTLERVHPDDRATIDRLEERVFGGPAGIRSVERRYVGRGGREVLANVTARLIRVPSSDAPVALYTIEDITERRRAEERTRSTEERFRRAASAISAVQDPAMVLRTVVASARETLQAEYAAVATLAADGSGMTTLEADGIDATELLARLGRSHSGAGVLGLTRRLNRPIRLRDVRTHPAFAGFPDEHPPMTSFLAVPIPHDASGSPTLYLANKIGGDEFSEADETIAVALATHAAVCLDNARINARALELVRDLDRANLELVRANDAKSAFLASVAHELRTPLHAMVVAGELVHDPPAGPLSDEEVRALGRTIESSGRHMVRLIDDLVDLSRIEAGRLDLRPTEVMVGDILAEIASSLGDTAASRGIALELPEGPGPSVLADPVRLRQILTNLIANALKFTERGGRVWVETVSARAATRVTVHDTGIGIAPEDLERAFLPFEQVSRTSTPGAGLGLAISRSLAELHGGELTATSEPGVGSAFTLTLPRRTQPAPPSAPVPPAVGHAADDGRGRPVLVVEDDPVAIGLASDVLRMAGYQVWQARGLAEAIGILDVAAPALILLDIRLADGSGLELARRLRSGDVHADLPIVVMSADAMPDDVRRAREAGCDDFLAKPVSARVLLARIHGLMGEAPVRA